MNLISKTKADTAKTRLLNELALEFRRNDPEKAIKYAEQALTLYKNMSDKKGLSLSYSLKGTAKMNMGDHAEAYDNLNKAIREGEKLHEHKTVAGAYNNIGIIYLKQGNSTEALKYYLEGLKIREREGLKSDAASSYLNIGNVYYQQENYPEAVKYYRLSLPMFDKNNKFGIGNALHNIGFGFLQDKKMDSALYYYNRALALAEEIGDKRGIASCYESIAELNLVKKDYKTAQEYLAKGLALCNETKDERKTAEIYFSMAKIALATNKFDEVTKNVELVRRIAEKDKDIGTLRDCFLMLSKVEQARGNFREALQDYQKFTFYRDSIISVENAKKIVEEKMTYDFKKKEEQLKQEQLKKDIYAEEQLKSQKLFTRASMIVGCLILGLLILSVFAYRDKKRSHQIIETQKALVEEKQQSILDSISYAKKLQQAVLPKLDIVTKLFPDNFILYLPKDIVAGDFYWVTETNDSSYLAICDCTGHGVPGAFMSLLNVGFLSEAIKERNIKEPNTIFDYVRTRLIEGIGNEGQQDGMDGILMRFDKKTKKINYAAAHNAPVMVSNKHARLLGVDKIPVGKGIKTDPFRLFELEFKKGDCLYLFTDGFADQFGGPLGKKFKYRKLEELLLSIHDRTCEEQRTVLEEAFKDWKGSLEQVDDVLVMGLKL